MPASSHRERAVRLGMAEALRAVRPRRFRPARARHVLEHGHQSRAFRRRLDALGADAARPAAVHAVHRRLSPPDGKRIARHPPHRAGFGAAPDRRPHPRPGRGGPALRSRRSRGARRHRQRRTHIAGRAAAGRQCRRGLGAIAGVARGHQRDDRRRRVEAAGRRGRADPRLFRRAGTQVAPDRGDGRRTGAGERAASRGRHPEGRVPEPGQPRGAHPDDLDPLVQRYTAQQSRYGRSGETPLSGHHPERKPPPDPAARRDTRPQSDGKRRTGLGGNGRSTRKRRSTRRSKAARPWRAAAGVTLKRSRRAAKHGSTAIATGSRRSSST